MARASLFVNLFGAVSFGRSIVGFMHPCVTPALRRKRAHNHDKHQGAARRWGRPACLIQRAPICKGLNNARAQLCWGPSMMRTEVEMLLEVSLPEWLRGWT